MRVSRQPNPTKRYQAFKVKQKNNKTLSSKPGPSIESVKKKPSSVTSLSGSQLTSPFTRVAKTLIKNDLSWTESGQFGSPSQLLKREAYYNSRNVTDSIELLVSSFNNGASSPVHDSLTDSHSDGSCTTHEFSETSSIMSDSLFGDAFDGSEDVPLS